MDQKPNNEPSRWEKLKQAGLEKLKQARKTVQEKAQPIKEGMEEAGEMAKGVGQAAKALYWDLPKEMYKEMTEDEREESEKQDAVQQTNKSK